MHGVSSIIPVTLVVIAATVPSLGSGPRELTFDERVQAQAAIERVYHSHRTGSTESFEELVPRRLLKEKVRSYLERSVALEEFWNTPVTAAMLEREIQRMARDTKMPDRLRELFSALRDDPLLIQESLARQVLVDRLTRNFFAWDERIHGATRRDAEELAASLSRRAIDPRVDHPRRSVVEFVQRVDEGIAVSGADGRTNNLFAARVDLDADEFSRQRQHLPGRVGEIGLLTERRESYDVEVVLDESATRVTAASYSVPKMSWDAWWQRARQRFDGMRVRPAGGPRNGIDLRTLLSQTAKSVPCLPDDTWDNGSLDDLPQARDLHTAVWTGSEMIVWGGFDGSVDLNSGHRYNPATDLWTPVSTINAPSARESHTAVWTGEVMVVWGGYQGYPVFDAANTGSRYDPVSETWASTSTTGAPQARWLHTAVWTGNKMIVWGGAAGEAPGGDLDSGSRYDPVADIWSRTTLSNAPSIRRNHTAVWTGTHMLVWGGERLFYDPVDSGGRYDPISNSWSAISTANAPQARYNHTGVWTGSQMVVWGGESGGGSPQNLETGGRYDPLTDDWTPTSTADAPPGASEHAAIWTGTSMVVWGGVSGGWHLGTGGRYDPLSDAWTATSAMNAPSPRTRPTAIWTGSHMIVWGGVVAGPDQYSNTGGRYDWATDSWTPTSTAGAPAARIAHTAVWTGTHLIVWGGIVGFPAFFTNTGSRYDPAIDDWTSTSSVNAPEARGGHTAVWTGSEMIVWGGQNAPAPSGSAVNTGARYQPLTDIWIPTSTTGVPGARAEHSVAWTGSEMVVWGGKDVAADTVLDTGGRYDPSTDTWAPTALVDAPDPRLLASAVWTGTEMIVWGGLDPYLGSFNTGGRYEPTTDTWAPTTLTDAPSPRLGHSAIWTGAEMIVWGGSGGQGTGHRYDPLTDSWTPVSTIDAPTPRDSHTAVWTEKVMVVWGGYTGGAFRATNEGGRYDPLTDHWTPTSTVNAPSRRWYHEATWTGSFMVVWGGIGTSALNTGGRYALGHSDDDDGDGFSECDGDCDDANPNVYLSAPESCDQLDNNCNGAIDEGWDVDSDDAPDCSDNCPEISNPDQSDTDLDGAGDVCDNCPGTTNRDQADSDADGLGDACDACTDIDSDLFCAGEDNCPLLWNSLQADDESDGVGNVCDVCPGAYDSSQTDSDGDGAGDACDCQPDDPNDLPPAEAVQLEASRSGSVGIMLNWIATSGADVYSVTRVNLSSLALNDYGSCLVEGISENTFEDPSPPAPGDGYAYLVQGQNFECGLGSLGFSSLEEERLDGNPALCQGIVHTDAYPQSESPVSGSVSGSFLDTTASDDVIEMITEELSGGNPANRFSHLEHRWTIQVSSGTWVEVHVEGFRSSSADGDDFAFQYSTDGVSWSPIPLPSLPLADDETDLVVSLPPTLSGAVTFRVVDTDRTPGNQGLDTVSIDELFVRSVP